MGDISKSEKELFEQWAKPDSVQAMVDHEGNYIDHGMRVAFTGWLARSKINSTTARVAELEAGMGEPVAWVEFAPGSDYCFIAYSHNPKADSYPLFRTPPTVAAALRKAAEVCLNATDEGNLLHLVSRGYANRILEIPHDDSALREICMRVAEIAYDKGYEDERDYPVGGKVKAIVDRVLGK